MNHPTKTPRYTDAYRFPDGYTPANSTSVAKTFERARKRLEAARKVIPIKKVSA
jgi:hypothetical protein